MPNHNLSQKLISLPRVKSWPIGLTALVSMAIVTSACGHPSDGPGLPLANGCYKGQAQLTASPGSARAFQLVTLKLDEQWYKTPAHDVSTESYGLLGRVENLKFIPVYNLAAIANGVEHEPNIRVSNNGSTGIGGVGLPDRPFQIKIPKVNVGGYVLEFNYTVSSKSVGHKTYILCTRLHVSS